uniref:galactose-3-O-sulfotransferase 2 n=1 Tax=Semicossyphus pulcher TaxID=241346 RepID=UPI0037E71BEE
MLSPQRRWIREKLVSSVTSCVGRWLRFRRPSVFTLLVLFIVFITFQSFIARQTRNEKLSGATNLRLAFDSKQLFPTLWNILQGLSPEKSEQTGTADSLLNEEGEMDALINPGTDSQVKKRLRELLLPKDRGLVYNHSPPVLSENPKETTCSPQSHIVFLKTHKTASSTILNILYRYGESRNLTFALPMKRHKQLFYPYFFSQDFVEGVRSQTVKEFHIMCNHMRFRQPQVAQVMPEDTFYFSILRNPVAMMESIYSYYRSMRVFKKTNSLEHFLEIGQTNPKSPLSKYHYSHNILAFDFGHENNVTADSADLEETALKVIKAIEQDFDLILIAEYFDESLILLRHSLCWSLDDVASFKLNSRSKRSRQMLSPDTTEKIKHWNALDWRIYVHFNATFRDKVNSLVGAEQMKKEVTELRELQTKLANICLLDGGAVDPAQIRDRKLRPFQSGKAIIQGYNVNPGLDFQNKMKCQRLVTPELQYTDLLYRKQFPELTGKQKG